jgi:glycosyltransferase involved in cell wall biosynthesis
MKIDYIYDITFFVPCLNEEENITNALDTIIIAVSETNLTYEILVIDDNSTDRTINRVEEFKNRHPHLNINLIRNDITKGLGTNYVDGAFIGKGKYYMLVNGDNAEPKETILSIIGLLGKADMIVPYFEDQDNRSFFRSILSTVFTFLINIVSGYRIKYYNGPVLHLRYNVMRWSPDTFGFAYQAELITRILIEGNSYQETKIVNTDREAGTSKAFSIENIFSITHSLLQIFFRRLRQILFYKNR